MARQLFSKNFFLKVVEHNSKLIGLPDCNVYVTNVTSIKKFLTSIVTSPRIFFVTSVKKHLAALAITPGEEVIKN